MNDEQALEKIEQLSSDLLNKVLDELDLENNEEYRQQVYDLLKRQAHRHIIFSIWRNLDEAQASHLKDYLNQSSVIDPGLSTDTVLIEFALLYPKLLEKIYSSLSDFFKDFIESNRDIL
jgi:hypothetical protein